MFCLKTFYFGGIHIDWQTVLTIFCSEYIWWCFLCTMRQNLLLCNLMHRLSNLILLKATFLLQSRPVSLVTITCVFIHIQLSYIWPQIAKKRHSLFQWWLMLFVCTYIQCIYVYIYVCICYSTFQHNVSRLTHVTIYTTFYISRSNIWPGNVYYFLYLKQQHMTCQWLFLIRRKKNSAGKLGLTFSDRKSFTFFSQSTSWPRKGKNTISRTKIWKVSLTWPFSGSGKVLQIFLIVFSFF
jgi:hypothetical protein